MRALSGRSAARGRENPASFGRAVTASVIVVLGGVLATILGLFGPANYHLGYTVGHLLMVLVVSGITLTVAGIVDGGRRYLSAGVSLLYVAVSATIIDRLPGWWSQGWVYGVLFIVWGGVAAIRLLSQRSRQATADHASTDGARAASPVVDDARTTAPAEAASVRR